ncbi:nucleoside transporter protein [Cystoisospora suis]|uniref:Nucleoside transporter protein n=1 Tax=Cystoisospora suis TaxID=483139 RepID=A0A2C6KF80_9APIC|nr:nucleoside transporter protein [Cystoisospora suis]
MMDMDAMEDVDLGGPAALQAPTVAHTPQHQRTTAAQLGEQATSFSTRAFLHSLTPLQISSDNQPGALAEPVTSRESSDQTSSVCPERKLSLSSKVGAVIAVETGVPCVGSSPFTSRDRLSGFLTFLICGIASLICWQFLLSMTPYIEMTFFGATPIGNSLLGVYQVGCICVQLLLMFVVESMQPCIVICAAVLDGVLALLFPLIISCGSRGSMAALMHVVSFFFGLSAGVICGGSISVASAMPYNFIGAFSVGQGIAGILSFFVNLVCSTWLFDLATSEGLVRMLWLVFGTSAAISFTSACLLLVAAKQPWAARQLTRYWEAKQLRKESSRWKAMYRRWKGVPPAPRFRASGPEDQVAANGTSRAKRTAVTDDHAENARCLPEQKETAYCVSQARSVAAPAGPGVQSKSSRTSGEKEANNMKQLQGDGGRKQTQAGWEDEKESGERPQDNVRSHNNPNIDPTGRMGPRGSTEGRPTAVCDEQAECVGDEQHWPSRGWRWFLRDSGVFLFCVFLNFFVTLNLYPRVGPIMWHYPGFSKNGPQYIILFGVFCMGDFFGKSIPDIAGLSAGLKRWLMIPRKYVLAVVLGRLLLVVFFLLGAYLVPNTFFNSFAVYVILMLILAITSGWCATTSMLYACSSVRRFEEKEIVGPMSVLMLLLGIMAGVYSALAY